MTDDRRTWVRLAAGGFVAALAVGLTGWTLEIRQLGWNDAETAARVEREVRTRIEAATVSLREVADTVARRPDLVVQDGRPEEVTGRLFAWLAEVHGSLSPERSAVTVYGPGGVTLAWSGRPSEIPRDRITGPEALFVVPSHFGLRLFFVLPILQAPTEGTAEPRRVGTVSAELALPLSADGGPSETSFRLPTSVLPVSIRPGFQSADVAGPPGRFLVRAPSGEPLLEVDVPPGDVAELRARWRRGVVSAVTAVLAATLLLLVGPLLDRRLRAHRVSGYLRLTGAALLLILLARGLLWLVMPAAWLSDRPFSGSTPFSSAFEALLRSPLDLLLTSLTLAGIVALAAPGVANLRVRRRLSPGPGRPAWGRLVQVAAGLVLAILLLGHQLFVSDVVRGTDVDLLRFSLHPWGPSRLTLILGLLLFQAANIWASTLVAMGALAALRGHRRSSLARAGVPTVWVVPSVGLSFWCESAGWPVPALAVSLAAVTVALAALSARRAVAWYRHATQAPRLLALSSVVLVPGLLLYPAVYIHADEAKRVLVETSFAEQPAAHPQHLQVSLLRALREIDEVAALADLVAAAPTPLAGQAPIESAFRVWSQTNFADSRLTSAVELYGPTGVLVSRFALNFPEYTALAQNYAVKGCTWEIFGEAAPFGAEERRMLHAERSLCESGGQTGPSPRHLGTVVVHVMLDYSTLPFIASQGPYQQLLRVASPTPAEGVRGGDVELVIYGWGLLPIYASGAGAWPIDEALFERIYASRAPFWNDVRKADEVYQVHFSNDRYGIYALGYPAFTVSDHLERLAEVTSFCGLVYASLIVGAAVFVRLARQRARSGTVLLREIRASFYRKLFLAFVLASAVPVLTLTFAAREYFGARLRTDAEADAVRTAAVARRVVEELAALQQRGGGTLAPVTDDLMVLISQLINQDVNLFDDARLIATSERDLFAWGLLPQRTPAEVYRAIRLQRLPSYVGEDAIGPVRYLMSAAPVRWPGLDAILTVPFALRQREFEAEIDEVNRGIHLAAVLFILLGAGIGVWMAERIADPVRRLTRATRRVARGDFDARILVRSSDELQRLVDAFNSMAAELKAQATQLERTHRLEAWAEMARQVAHEIKNPLTPIQLSAEHLGRVHADRGAPLSPVLEGCVESILRQVDLLRQIAGEFSAFASAPAPRPAPVALDDLLRDVVAPYRIGLGGRILLELDLASDLPPVFIDRLLVARAVVNVVENALQAMPGEGVLSIVARVSGAGVQTTITDTGLGMDPEALTRVFEPYFSTRTAGTGLGLTIAKRNVEANRGTVVVTSERGRGTSVVIWLPAATPGAGPQTT